MTALPEGAPEWVPGSVPGWLLAHPWLTAVTAVATLVAVVAGREWLRGWRHRRLTAGARWVTIAAPPQVEPHSAAVLWTTMTGILTVTGWRRRLYGDAHVCWEYTWAGRTLTVRLWVPGTVRADGVVAAVRAAWPACTVTVGDAGPPVPVEVGAQAGGALWPQQGDALPLRTDHDDDPLRAMLAVGAGVRDREYACVQILARPASARKVRANRRTASGPPGGAGTDPVARMAGGLVALAVEPVLAVLEVFLPGPSRRSASARPAVRAVVRDPVADSLRRTVVDKTVRVPHLQVAVRYAVASGPVPADRQRSRQTRYRLTGLAGGFAAAAAAYTRPNRLRRLRLARPVAVLAARRMRYGFLATVEELGVLAGLPQDLAVPGLDRARARAMPAPAAVPSGGRTVKVLGRAQIGGHAVGLHAVDARQHVHLIGKTGVGKSTLLLSMILADIHARRGTVVIDPRGDLILDILDRLPASYADRIAIIDPEQPNPACFNPLDDDGDALLAVDNIVGAFAKIFQRHWGPRMDDTLRVACLTLMRHAHPTLALVPPLLTDRHFRARFTQGLSDPEGLGGYWEWYESMNEGQRALVIGPVLARLRAFLLRDFVRNVIGTPHTTLHMPQILDGGVLLCRLPKGVLGEDTTRVLGSLIVARVWQAAIARAAQPEQQRRDAALYIDEAQNFLNLPGSVEDMLAEARGFRLSLVLAHQNLAQLPPETANAVSANARSKVYFTVDPDDAKQLAKHTGPELDEHDLSHLDVHTAAARLLVGNRELPAFTLTTNPPGGLRGETAAIRAAVAAAHARPTGEAGMQQLARRAMQRRSTRRT